MPEEAAAPSAFFRRRGRVPRRGAIFCLSGRNDLLSSSISSVPKTSIAPDSSPPFLSLRGCRKGPPPLPLSSAGGGVYPARKQFVPRLRSMPSALPIHRRRSSSSGDAGRGRRPLPLSSASGGVYPAEERFSVCQDATTCRPLPFHPFRKPLPKENRFRYAKPGARHSRVPGFVSLVQRGFILSARLLTGENLPPTRSAAASPSTGSWSPRRFPTHNAHRGRSAPRTSCTSRPTAQPSPRQW